MWQNPFKHFKASVSPEGMDFTLGPGSYFALQTLQMNRAEDGHWRPFGGFTLALY